MYVYIYIYIYTQNQCADTASCHGARERAARSRSRQEDRPPWAPNTYIELSKRQLNGRNTQWSLGKSLLLKPYQCRVSLNISYISFILYQYHLASRQAPNASPPKNSPDVSPPKRRPNNNNNHDTIATTITTTSNHDNNDYTINNTTT